MIVKNIMRILVACFFALLTLVLHLVGRYAPDFVFLFYPTISQSILRVVGGFFSIFPMAMWEIIAVGLFIWLIYTLIRDLADLRIIQWFTGILVSVSVGAFALMLLWGLNDYSPPLHEQVGLSGKSYSVGQLREATIYYRDQANRTAKAAISRRNLDAFTDLAQEAADSYTILSVRYDCFRGPTAVPKRLILGEWLGFKGVFMPFTGESGISLKKTHVSCVPFLMCSEIGQGKGFTNRQEAEFTAFMACMVSDSPQLQYAGYFNAFSYCYNALYARDPQTAIEVWKGLSNEVRKDCVDRIEQEESPLKELILSDIQKDLQVIYAEFMGWDVEGPEHDSMTDLLTMWYYEKVL
jgi:hypothetical protein